MNKPVIVSYKKNVSSCLAMGASTERIDTLPKEINGKDLIGTVGHFSESFEKAQKNYSAEELDLFRH